MERLYIDERAIEVAHYIIDSKDTVRGAAKKFGISKSTVHKDITERLRKINPALAVEAKKILDENKAERHIRGGEATRQKYMHIVKWVPRGTQNFSSKFISSCIYIIVRWKKCKMKFLICFLIT